MLYQRTRRKLRLINAGYVNTAQINFRMCQNSQFSSDIWSMCSNNLQIVTRNVMNCLWYQWDVNNHTYLNYHETNCLCGQVSQVDWPIRTLGRKERHLSKLVTHHMTKRRQGSQDAGQRARKHMSPTYSTQDQSQPDNLCHCKKKPFFFSCLLFSRPGIAENNPLS